MKKKIAIFFFFILSLQIFNINSIAQTCNPNPIQSDNTIETSKNDYPSCYPISNTFCLSNGYCACKPGYFGNCNYQGQILNLQSMTFANITQQMKFFIIMPTLKQDHHQIAFKIMISTNQTEINMSKILININFWIDNDQLSQPSSFNSLDDQETTMKLKYGSNRYVTEQYKFKKKHNGECSQFIIGISLANRGVTSVTSPTQNSTQNNVMHVSVGITYSQIQEQQDEQFQFLTVILVIFALILLAVLIQCFYFKKKHIIKSSQKSEQNLHSQEMKEMSTVFIKKDEKSQLQNITTNNPNNLSKQFQRMEQSAHQWKKE